jgi:hypothetical protein
MRINNKIIVPNPNPLYVVNPNIELTDIPNTCSLRENAHPRPMEERIYQEYFGSDIPDEHGGRYYSDVTEYLDDLHIGHAEVTAIIDRDIQSIVIGIPTCDNAHSPWGGF